MVKVVDILQDVELVFKEFEAVFLKDLPNEFPPMCNIKYAIDLILGANLANLTHYRMNPMEHVELKGKSMSYSIRASSGRV